MAVLNENSIYNQNIGDILEKIKTTDYISIFFLLIDYNQFSTVAFLEVVKEDHNFMKNKLLNIINQDRNGILLLIELMGKIQRNDLLYSLGSCPHSFERLTKEGNLNKLKKLWKVLYDISDQLDPSKDHIYLKKLLSDETIEDFNSPEIIFAKAFQKDIFTYSNLDNLSTLFKYNRKITSILDTYNESYVLESYDIRIPTTSTPCGLAIIINHENFQNEGDCIKLLRRKSSSLDVDALEELWRAFGFDVHSYKDLADVNVLEKFQKYAKSDLSKYDIFVTCYLSHGDEGIVYASNNKPVIISTLIDIMANKCDSLNGKPKMFFIQACQGKEIQRGIHYPSVKLSQESSNKAKKLTNIPKYSDVYKVVSSVPGFVSFTPDSEKSWFIEALVTNIEKYGNQLSIEDIMIKVTQQVSACSGNTVVSGENISNCKQIPISESTLTKKIQLKKVLT